MLTNTATCHDQGSPQLEPERVCAALVLTAAAAAAAAAAAVAAAAARLLLLLRGCCGRAGLKLHRVSGGLQRKHGMQTNRRVTARERNIVLKVEPGRMISYKHTLVSNTTI